jgi:hypothetical protein
MAHAPKNGNLSSIWPLWLTSLLKTLWKLVAFNASIQKPGNHYKCICRIPYVIQKTLSIKSVNYQSLSHRLHLQLSHHLPLQHINCLWARRSGPLSHLIGVHCCLVMYYPNFDFNKTLLCNLCVSIQFFLQDAKDLRLSWPGSSVTIV